MIAFILHRSGLLNASQGNNRGGRTNRLMTWHVLAEIVKDKWEQDGGWMMVLLRQQGIWSVRGTDIKGRHEVSCKSKRGGKKNHHYGSYPHTHNPFLKRKKKRSLKFKRLFFLLLTTFGFWNTLLQSNRATCKITVHSHRCLCQIMLS